MRLGPLELKSNLFLSPLAGYTNLPFRLTLREIGGLDLATTDLVNARSLIEKNPKAFKLIETCPADRPLAVQLFGSVPEEMRDAALYLEEMLFLRSANWRAEATRLNDLLRVFGVGPLLEAFNQCCFYRRFNLEFLEAKLRELLTRASGATIEIAPPVSLHAHR